MRHLSDETLARIADGPATGEETAHLDECPECRAELDAMRDQLATVESLPPPPLPDEVRERVEAAVLAERASEAGSASTGRYRRWGLRVAAALALFVGGAAVGAGWGGDPAGIAEREPVAGPSAEDPSPSRLASTEPAAGVPTGERTPSADEAPGGPSPETEALSGTGPWTDPPAERSASAARPLPADPAAALREAEARYVEALSRYAEEEGGPLEGDPLNRLAALEGILHTTRAALDASPGDPVLEGFYRSALVQREAMLNDVTITTAQAVY